MEKGGSAADLAALMGFSAFGRQRRPPPAAAAAASLDQLQPGTQLLAAFVASGGDRRRVSEERDGVACLLRDSGSVSSEQLAARLLPGGADERDERPLLPARSSELLRELQELKNRFEALDDAVFRRARTAANPHEALGRARFLNRSALKLVNLDHVFRWTRRRADGPADFAFADICGGPGGFSEFLLWRTASRDAFAHVRGYGISLKHAACDWKLPPRPPEAPQVAFEVSYGADGTGDVYALANVRHFRDRVLRRHPGGVDLVVADGGFQDARDERDQERVMTRLVVAEVLAMFAVLRPGGSFVCKTFELATPAMLHLVWLLHLSFAKLAVVKPITSRPASSERYIVALQREDAIPKDAIVAALESRLASSEQALQPLFDDSAVRGDAGFVAYMAAASDRFAEAQIKACNRIHALATASRRDKRKRGDAVDVAAYMKCWGLSD